MKKVLERILIFILVVILIFVFYLRFFKNVQYIKFFGYCFFIVKSGSMEPEISKDEFIITKDMNSYNKNEIVTFFYDECIITHRIVQNDNNKLITKGDFNNEIDFPITNKNILGKVVFHSKILGKIIINYLNIVIIFVVCICIIDIFVKRGKKK